jgi:hypothetical protein
LKFPFLRADAYEVTPTDFESIEDGFIILMSDWTKMNGFYPNLPTHASDLHRLDDEFVGR